MKPVDMSDSEWRDFRDERRRKAFLEACQSPGFWRLKALFHKRAADVLYERAAIASERQRTSRTQGELHGQELEDFYDVQLLGEYLLLAGYALECVLKGCLVAMDRSCAVDGEQIGKRIKTHKLRQLCRDCSIELDANEEQMLGLMTRHVEWGRYPVPTREAQMPGWDFDDGPDEKSLSVSNAFVERQLQVLVDGVFARVLVKLDRARADLGST